MFIHRRRPHEPRGGEETPPGIALHRRTWLKGAGVVAGAAALSGAGLWFGRQWWQADDNDVIARGKPGLEGLGAYYPARREEAYEYDRDETLRAAAAKHTNFYEFSRTKSVWRFVDRFEPAPWTLAIEGLCRRPITLDLEEFHHRYRNELVERQYRHRCVERWSMCVPWTGVPLARVLKDVDPLASATHVRFVSFDLPDQAANQRDTTFPWPYAEGLTVAEAHIDLVLLAVGMYGEPLLKQHGAPLRLVVPWKYGYKSIKSVTRIEFVARQPETFWNSVSPQAYSFESNVDPESSVPWPQRSERMLGSNEQFLTQAYNGYAAEVGHLYA